MRKSVIAIIIIVLVVLYMSVFVVKEGERGITLRFEIGRASCRERV